MYAPYFENLHLQRYKMKSHWQQVRTLHSTQWEALDFTYCSLRIGSSTVTDNAHLGCRCQSVAMDSFPIRGYDPGHLGREHCRWTPFP